MRTTNPSDSTKKWLAPAKLNLFLHITGRRDDGYHLLQTVFQLLDFGDELSFEVTDNSDIRMVSALDGVPDKENLVVRAANLLQSYTGCTRGALIQIDKKLPMGGGLGGGSSDAATTLMALNQLWETGLAREQLANLGLQLGADVPVFVHGSSAWATGVGECLQPILLDQHYYVVSVSYTHLTLPTICSV